MADSLRIIGPDSVYDEEYYRKRRNDPWRSDAHNTSKAIIDYFNPDTVIDFGCAIGAHLEAFKNEGIEIRGVEGNSDAIKHAIVSTEFLKLHDLRDPYQPERTYDLALCFEVAEHLPERYADVLVETLATSSNTVVMTAAPPGQGGTHHVNEQPREYWYEKFDDRGMRNDPEALEHLRNSIQVERTTWIPENLMVFRQSPTG